MPIGEPGSSLGLVILAVPIPFDPLAAEAVTLFVCIDSAYGVEEEFNAATGAPVWEPATPPIPLAFES